MPWPFARKLSSILAPEVTQASSSPGTRFAFRLFNELAVEDGANVFFSPSSVMLCLAMIHDAATGETRQEMAEALEIAGLDPTGTSRVIAQLKFPFRRLGVEIVGAQSLWCSDRVRVRAECAAKLRDLYDAQLATLDFESADAVPRINAWVNEKTKGKISHLLDRISPLAAVIAVNAIYFKGRWLFPFHRELTRDGLFTTATGKKKQLPMMTGSGRYAYYEDRELQAVALLYAGDMAMHVILPAPNSEPRRFQERLSSGAWESLLSRFEMTSGTIQIPRFKLDCRAPLEQPLKTLGMERAFDPARAEFDGIQAEVPPVWIDQVLHRAVAEVNEEGTEASGGAALIACLGASPNRWPQRNFQMIVDRPFFVSIRDETLGTIVFMGWVGDPG